MSLTSGIFKNYKKKFLLNEDGIRRLEVVLKDAAEKYNEELELIYRVNREDDRFYETNDLNDVLDDANVTNKKINMLRIELRLKNNSEIQGKGSETIVDIWFDNEDDPSFYRRDVMLKISSNDRTWALMLADELEPQISRLFKVKSKNYLFYVLFLCLFSVLIFKSSEFLNGENFELIRGVKDTILFTLLGSMITFLLTRVMALPKWLSEIFNNSSAFLWGEEEHEYRDRVRIKRNIHWTVFIGFIVSLSAGIILELI